MSIKQYLLLLPVVAATLFAYCTKEQQTPVQQNATDLPGASDRSKCEVTVTLSSGSAQVCGTNTMLSTCSVVNGEQLYGTANLVSGNSEKYGIQTASGGTPDGYLRFTNTAFPSPSITTINVATASGSVTFTLTAFGQTQNVAIDPFCVPSLI